MQSFFQRFGFIVRKSKGFYEATREIGRIYADATDDPMPKFILRKMPALRWAGSVTKITINNGKRQMEERIYYSHLTL